MKYFKKFSVLFYITGIVSLFFFNINQINAATTYSSEYIFNTATTYFPYVAGLTNSRFVVAYSDYGNSAYGTVRYCDKSGTEISGCSSEVVFNAGTTADIRIYRLTDTTFVVAFRDISNSSFGTAIIGNISGTTISFGSEYVFYNAWPYYIDINRLSDTKFVVVYKNASGFGAARIGEVSGTTISWGSEAIYKSTSGPEYNAIAALTENKFVVTYRDIGDTYNGKSIIGTVSGNVITFSGSETTFDTGQVSWTRVDRLTDDKFVISYQDQATSSYGFSIIGEISGYSISYGNRYQFNDAQSDYIDIAAVNDYTFITVFRDGFDSLYYGTAITGYVTNNVISFSDESVYNPGNTLFNYVSNMPSTPADFAIVYMDNGNSSYGTAIMGAEDAPGGPAVPEFSSLIVKILIGALGFMVVLFVGIYVKKKIIDPKKKKTNLII